MTSLYKTGNIYKIIHNQSDIIYIGSTFNTLRDRFSQHKSSFKKYLNNENAEIAIFPYFKKFGIENFKIILIKEYQVCDKKALFMWETLWMNKLKNINKQRAFQPLLKEQNRQTDIIYRQNNKNKKAEYDKKYREINKEKIKKRIITQINCECGGHYTTLHKNRHFQTKKHIQYTSPNNL